MKLKTLLLICLFMLLFGNNTVSASQYPLSSYGEDYNFKNDYNYEYKTESDSEFYNTGKTNFNYNGEIPDYLKEIYDYTPHPVHNSEFGSNIITVPNQNTMTNQAIQNAPSNAPVKNSANYQTNQVNNYGSSNINGGTSQTTGNTFSSAPSNPSLTQYPALPNGTSKDNYPNSFGNVFEEKLQYPITPIEQVRKSDGEIGTLKIPKINLTVKAYDGDTFEAMKKGVGHIAQTSAWNSNIGLVGHNRGTNDYFGKLKNLTEGDEMTYTTSLGTRTYIVRSIQRINETDWSFFEYTSENKLTLLTCVEDVPTQRLCVVAVEKR